MMEMNENERKLNLRQYGNRGFASIAMKTILRDIENY